MMIRRTNTNATPNSTTSDPNTLGEGERKGEHRRHRREDQQSATEAGPREVVRHELVTWVIAKTTTSSKNSSRGVTRCSRSIARSAIRAQPPGRWHERTLGRGASDEFSRPVPSDPWTKEEP